MKPQRGFSLIELAIVLVIITVLIGGLAVPLTAQIQSRRIAETNRTLEEAREAIIGYAMSHTVASSCTCNYNEDTTLKPTPDSSCPMSLCPSTGTTLLTLPITRHYLPCPSNDGTGIESRCNNAGGCGGVSQGACIPCKDANHDNLDDDTGKRCNLLPWVTLGTGNQDAWGNRLDYYVENTYADNAVGITATPAGNGQICSSISGGCTGIVADKVPVVILSHGPNGWGARSVNSSTLTNPASNDEKANLDGDATFVSRTPTPSASAQGEFDDLVTWIPDSLIRARVCPAGGCP